MRLKIAAFSVILVLLSFATLLVGSIKVLPSEIFQMMFSALKGSAQAEPLSSSIILELRLPRLLLAFCVGAIVSITGAVMQSILKNPLASSYTLGVSAGAALGASLVIVFGLTVSFLGVFTISAVGMVFSLLVLLFVVYFSNTLDKGFGSQTVILTGMVISLFVNAILTFMQSAFRSSSGRLVLWQQGSFALKDYRFVAISFLVMVFSIWYFTKHSSELDNLTFNDEMAYSAGVDVKKTRKSLLIACAVATGAAVSLVGVIGFVDLVAPHVVRKIFGSSHRLVLPLCAVCGGSFMVFADTIARTVFSPSELSVGAVTAIIGAPIFAFIFLVKEKK